MINGKQIAELEERLNFHRDLATAYALTIADLKGSARAKVAKRAPATLRNAAKLDRERRKGHSRKKSSGTGTVAAVKERRRATAAYLQTFDREEPRPIKRGMTAVVIAGYLRKKGDGYIRTAKEFTP